MPHFYVELWAVYAADEEELEAKLRSVGLRSDVLERLEEEPAGGERVAPQEPKI